MWDHISHKPLVNGRWVGSGYGRWINGTFSDSPQFKLCTSHELCCYKRCTDTLDLGQFKPKTFGTIRLVLRCPDILAPVPNCPVDSSALGPKCLDLHQTFFSHATVERCIFTACPVAWCRDVFHGAKMSVTHFGTSANMSGQFGTGAKVSYGHFDISAEMSWVQTVMGLKCLCTVINKCCKRGDHVNLLGLMRWLTLRVTDDGHCLWPISLWPISSTHAWPYYLFSTLT